MCWGCSYVFVLYFVLYCSVCENCCVFQTCNFGNVSGGRSVPVLSVKVQIQQCKATPLQVNNLHSKYYLSKTVKHVILLEKMAPVSDIRLHPFVRIVLKLQLVDTFHYFSL